MPHPSDSPHYPWRHRSVSRVQRQVQTDRSSGQHGRVRRCFVLLVLMTVSVIGMSRSGDAEFQDSTDKTPIHRTANTQPDTADAGRVSSSGKSLITLGLLLAAAIIVRRIVQHRVSRQSSSRPIIAELLDLQQVDNELTVRVLQIGSRILIVGSSPQGLATLSEITDSAEIAALRGERPAEDLTPEGSPFTERAAIASKGRFKPSLSSHRSAARQDSSSPVTLGTGGV